MTYRGKIQNGVVVLENGAALPEGTEVEVHAAPAAEATPDVKTLQQGLLGLAGTLKGYPRDLARNHDHYIHGSPKKP